MRTSKLFSLILVFAFLVTAFVGCGKDTSDTPSAGAGRDKTTEKAGTASDIVSDTDTSAKETETETEVATEYTETEEDTTEEETEKASDPSSTGEAIAALAQSLIGSKFEMGAIGPNTFDNSGFVYYCCAQNGVFVPRLASGLATAGTSVKLSELAPGDILVFSADVGGEPSFVSIYVGNNSFVACFKPERPTNIQAIDNYWSARFITARRVG